VTEASAFQACRHRSYLRAAMYAEPLEGWVPPINAVCSDSPALSPYSRSSFASPMQHQHAIYITAEGKPCACRCQRSARGKQVDIVCISPQLCMMPTSESPHPSKETILCAKRRMAASALTAH